MTIQSSVLGKVACWSALIVPLGTIGLSSLIRARWPELMCMPVNPGGKEYVCGPAYSHVVVRDLFSYFMPSIWAAALSIGGVEIVRGRVRRSEKVVWVLSLIALVGLGILVLGLANDDFP